MRKIVIIGNSAGGVSAAETIREKDKESKITIVSNEQFSAYRRDKIFEFLEGKFKEKELYFKNKDFYASNSIELLLENEVVELNTRKKKIVFKDDSFLDFDELIIASGSRVLLPDIKGAHKEGVVALTGLKDVKCLMESLPLAHTVIVVGAGPLSKEISRIVSAKKVEVKYLGVLEQPIDGVEAIDNNPITEILGDSEVKAVRLSSNKVIGASVVIYTGPRNPRVDFLRDTDIKVDRFIIVDQQMRTSVPNIYAVGDVCQIEAQIKPCSWEQAQADGKIAGELLSNSANH